MSRASLKNVSRLISIANEETSIADQFAKDLGRSIELSEEKGWGTIPSKTFKPSGMSCIRYSYYQLMGCEPDSGKASSNMTAICWAGTDMHERVQQAVSEMAQNDMPCYWINVEGYVNDKQLKDIAVREQRGYETKLYNEKYNISFMCDGIIEYRGKYYILEIKNESSNKWYNRTDVDPKHYNQAICYALSLHINDVMFLYIDRDLQNRKAYVFHVSEKMKDDIVSYMDEVNGYVKRKITPPKPEDSGKAKCQYCIYTQICKREK